MYLLNFFVQSISSQYKSRRYSVLFSTNTHFAVSVLKVMLSWKSWFELNCYYQCEVFLSKAFHV